MPLKITLGKNESCIINGSVITNTGSRATLSIENRSDVIRASEIIQEDEADTPIKQVYFLVQSALIHGSFKEEAKKVLVEEIQTRLGRIAALSSGADCALVFEAANHVSNYDFFRALRTLKSVIELDNS